MNSLDVFVAVYSTAMMVVSLLVVIYREPLAHWLRPQTRYWRNRPDAQRLYERATLLGGIGIGAFCVMILDCAVVVLPRLERTLAEVTFPTPREVKGLVR